DVGHNATWFFNFEMITQIHLGRYAAVGGFVGVDAAGQTDATPANPALAQMVGTSLLGFRAGGILSGTLPLRWLSLRLSTAIGYRNLHVPITAFEYTSCSTYRGSLRCGTVDPPASIDGLTIAPRLWVMVPFG